MPTYFVYGALMAHPLVKKNGQAACIKDYAVEMRLIGGARLIEPSFAVHFKAYSSVVHNKFRSIRSRITTLADIIFLRRPPPYRSSKKQAYSLVFESQHYVFG